VVEHLWEQRSVLGHRGSHGFAQRPLSGSACLPRSPYPPVRHAEPQAPRRPKARPSPALPARAPRARHPKRRHRRRSRRDSHPPSTATRPFLSRRQPLRRRCRTPLPPRPRPNTRGQLVTGALTQDPSAPRATGERLAQRDGSAHDAGSFLPPRRWRAHRAIARGFCCCQPPERWRWSRSRARRCCECSCGWDAFHHRGRWREGGAICCGAARRLRGTGGHLRVRGAGWGSRNDHGRMHLGRLSGNVPGIDLVHEPSRGHLARESSS
jgi:hypothetical protein